MIKQFMSAEGNNEKFVPSEPGEGNNKTLVPLVIYNKELPFEI